MKSTRLFIFPSLPIFLTSLTLLAVLSAHAQVPSYVPPNGLVGYWPFNGNANDESGNGNNGIVNGATLTTDRFGNDGSAYNFSGSSVNIPLTQAIVSYPARTLSFWFNSVGGQSGGRLFEATNVSWGIGCYNSNVFDCWFQKSNQGYGFVGLNFGNHNVWHNLIFSCDSINQNSSLYIDGVLINSMVPVNNPGNPTNWQNQFIRFGLGLANESFNGKIDDIALYNRSLTESEALSIFNGCSFTPIAVAGSNTPGAFANSTYTCNSNAGSTYNWTVSNGVIASGQGTNSVSILWGAEGVGSVSVVETTADGCVGDAVVYDVNVQCVVSGNAIEGPVGPEAFSNSTYTCNGAGNSSYQWTITNGVIVSGQGTSSVTVLWASTGLGNISVIETTAEGCVGTTLSQDVVVIPTNVEELSNALILYPNPATTELNLQITSDLIGTDLFVFDALGKQILKQQILSTNTIINTSSFAVGNYVVKVRGGVKKFEVVR